MIGRYGLVGAIYVDTSMSAGLYAERQGRTIFEHQHLKLMLAIAGQAALAIEDTQFYLAMLQAERLAAMGQTIANLSHHVKNILQGVRGGSYLVDDGLKKQDLAVIGKGLDDCPTQSRADQQPSHGHALVQQGSRAGIGAS